MAGFDREGELGMINRFMRSTAMAMALSFCQLAAPDIFVYAAGIERPDWMPPACCSPQDLHKLRADQVYKDQFGSWRIEGYPYAVPDNVVNPYGKASQDENYWATYCEPTTNAPACTAGEFSKIWCFYTPLNF